MHYWIHCDNVDNSIGVWLDGVITHPRAIRVKEGLQELEIPILMRASSANFLQYKGLHPPQIKRLFAIVFGSR
jgi:hypothetical protein